MLLAAGNYTGVSKDVGMDTSKKGSTYLDIIFEITHVAENGQWIGIDPQDRHLRLFLTDAAWSYTERKLDDLEFNGDFKNPQITDKGVILECEHEIYEGQTREKWDLPGDGNRDRQAPPDDELRKLSARYKTATANNKMPAGIPSMPSTTPEPSPTPDGIPF